jgi:hypothetical protein
MAARHKCRSVATCSRFSLALFQNRATKGTVSEPADYSSVPSPPRHCFRKDGPSSPAPGPFLLGRRPAARCRKPRSRREPAAGPLRVEDHQARNGVDDRLDQRRRVAVGFEDCPKEQDDMRFAASDEQSCQPGAGGFVDGGRLEGLKQPVDGRLHRMRLRQDGELFLQGEPRGRRARAALRHPRFT